MNSLLIPITSETARAHYWDDPVRNGYGSTWVVDDQGNYFWKVTAPLEFIQLNAVVVVNSKYYDEMFEL